MNLQIVGYYIEVMFVLCEYVENKLDFVVCYFDKVIGVSVVLFVEKFKQKVEVMVYVLGKDMYVEEFGDDFYVVIDSMFDKLDCQVLKYKQKVQDYYCGDKFVFYVVE